jgi:hypothetical protein
MKDIVNKSGDRIAVVDDQNRIVQGHHKVKVYRDLGHELFIKDGDTLTPATFVTGAVLGSLTARNNRG